MDTARLEAFGILLQDVRSWANDLLLRTNDYDTEEDEELADRKLRANVWAYNMFMVSGKLAFGFVSFPAPRRPIPHWPFPRVK